MRPPCIKTFLNKLKIIKMATIMCKLTDKETGEYKIAMGFFSTNDANEIREVCAHINEDENSPFRIALSKEDMKKLEDTEFKFHDINPN